MKLVLQAAEVERLITVGFKSDKPFFQIDELRPGFAQVRMLFRNWMLRPGDTISGPALFTAADVAMYVLVLSHVGPEMMAVTSNLNLHFLDKGGFSPSSLEDQAILSNEYCSAMHNRYLIVLYNDMRGSERECN